MPRKARSDYPTPYFHVIVQGYEKQFIFEEEGCKRYYLRLIFDEAKKISIEILAYCVMGNHTHLLIHCMDISEMSKFMKNVNSKYAEFYNVRNMRVGYVFRDRYKSQPIKNEQYLYSCIAYIHRNPVKAGICKRLEDYKYSSYNDYIKGEGVLTENARMKIFGACNDIQDFVEVIHTMEGCGMEFSKDPIKLSNEQAAKIANELIKEYGMAFYELNDNRVAKHLVLRLRDMGFKMYQIQKNLCMGYKRVHEILHESEYESECLE